MINNLTYMEENKVPKDLLMKFVRLIIIPSVNYGAFIDKNEESVK